MTINIDSKEITKALKKVCLVMGETVILAVTLKKNEENKNYATISSANKNAQVAATIMVEADITMNEQIIFGSEFITTIEAISQCGEIVQLKKNENKTVSLSCASVEIVLETKEDGGYIKNLSPKTENPFVYRLDTKSFQYAIYTGGYTFTSDGANEALQDTICLQFGQEKVNVFSIAGNGGTAAKSSCSVQETNNSNSDSISFLASGKMLSKISKCFYEKEVELYLFHKKQLLIRNGNDFYTILAKMGDFPNLEPFFEKKEENFVDIILSVQEIKRAIDIVLLNKRSPKIEIELESNQILLFSEDHKNKIACSYETEKEYEKIAFAVNATLLKNAINHFFERLHIKKGKEENSYIYITEDTKPGVTLLLPCRR